MFRSVRIQLTLWYVSILAVALVAFSFAVYTMMARALHERLDANLRNVTAVAALSLQHEIEEHEGTEIGEKSFRDVLGTMHHTTFPRQGIAVYDGSRLVAIKPGEHGLKPRYHGESDNLHTNGDLRDSVQRVHVPLARTTYEIVATERLSTANVELQWLRRSLFAVVPVMLLFIGLGGWWLAQRTLQPVIEMSRRLESSVQQQKQFMADASHELRTPMSVARTAADVTLEASHREEADYRESLTIIQQQLRRLTRIVQDMFTLAQADAGVYRLQRSLFYLDELVRECVSAAEVLGSRRSISIEMERAPEAPCHGDEGLVRQLIMILLDNSIKYTLDGGSVRVSLYPGDREWRVRVSDTGIGIPTEAHELIFRRFYRVDKARSRATAEAGSGAGLGLAIAQWIAEAHHGRLELTSSCPGATVFTATLPVGSTQAV